MGLKADIFLMQVKKNLLSSEFRLSFADPTYAKANRASEPRRNTVLFFSSSFFIQYKTSAAAKHTCRIASGMPVHIVKDR